MRQKGPIYKSLKAIDLDILRAELDNPSHKRSLHEEALAADTAVAGSAKESGPDLPASHK